MPALPKLVQTPSPNYSDRRGQRIRLIVVHDTEGGYSGAVAWFTQKVSQVSSHLVMREDGAEVTQMVPLNDKAWHVVSFNSVAIGIEGAGAAATGFSDAWWQSMASIVAWLLRRYGLPCRWAQGGNGDGYCSHHDLGAAGGGHQDPCGLGAPAWKKFETLVQAAYDEFGAGPLPDWALHGLPAPSVITLPSPAPVAIGPGSHGGAPGAEPGEFAVHPTPSGFPAGAVGDIQNRLNRAGAQPPLDADGLSGAATVAAIVAFQRAHGLVPDGVVGPATWSALQAAAP